MGETFIEALEVIESLGLILFVTSVGFIAGPKFFGNMKKNFKSYVLLGLVVILAGGLGAIGCIFIGDGIGYDEFAERIKGNAIALVDLRDNGNVGTIIRTAAALDCDILLCGSCADIFASKTVRATMGAVFTNDIYVCADTLSAIQALQKSK